jgi:hypothetical protein
MNVRPWNRDGAYHALVHELEVGWAPVIGPSSLIVWRRANSLFLSRSSQGFDTAVDAELLGAMVGLRGTTRKGTNIVKSLRRLSDFGLASIEGDDVYVAVHADLPSPRLRARTWPSELEEWAAGLPSPVGVRIAPTRRPA